MFFQLYSAFGWNPKSANAQSPGKGHIRDAGEDELAKPRHHKDKQKCLAIRKWQRKSQIKRWKKLKSDWHRDEANCQCLFSQNEENSSGRCDKRDIKAIYLSSCSKETHNVLQGKYKHVSLFLSVIKSFQISEKCSSQDFFMIIT